MSSCENSNWRSARRSSSRRQRANLEVAVHPPDHEQLFGQLGALRQRVERAAVQTRRDGELPGTLRGGRPEQRGLDLHEPLAHHGGADGRVDPRTQPQVALHPRSAQVHVAVAQPDGFVGLRTVVDGEGRWFGFVQHLHGAVPDLHLARLEPWVDRPLGAVPDRPADRDHPLAAHVDGAVDHALDDAAVVAQVDEGQVLAVLAPASHPAAQAHARAHVSRSEHAAQVGAQRGGLVLGDGHVDRVFSTTRRTSPTTSSRSTLRCASSLRSGRRPTVPASSS